MIEYEVASSSKSESLLAISRYVFATTGNSDTVEAEVSSDDRYQGAQTHRQPVNLGAAATLHWQSAVETSFGDGPRWEMPHPHMLKMRIVSPLGTEMPTAVSEAKRATDVITSWEQVGKGRLASFYVVYFIEQSFRLRAYEQVNRLLGEIDVAPLTEWSMIALLRASFSARTFLPAWPRLLGAVREKLQAEGKDTQKLLRGLIR